MTLTFNVPEQIFQMALLHVKENNWAKLFLKSMNKSISYGPDKSGQTHNPRMHEPCTSHTQRMHINRTEVVPTMSRSLQAGSTEMQWNQDGKRGL